MSIEREHRITNENLIISRINQIQFGNPKDIALYSVSNDVFNEISKKYIDLYVDVENVDTKEESKMKIRIYGGRFEFFDIEEEM